MNDDGNPKSVGVIMDGNRRWAKLKGLPSFEGHRKGYEVFKDFLNWAQDLGFNTVFSYVFSEENWKREEGEVSFLLSLIRKIVDEEAEDFIKKGIRVRFAGSIENFPKDIYDSMISIQNRTENNSKFNLCLCVSYGGRTEILNSINKILKNKNSGDEITMDDLKNNLYTAGFNDPDLVIRTSGEKRLSGFLPFQSVYSELFFTDTFWPDFSKNEFIKIIDEYKNRERRMGK